jgi:tricorn protease
MTTRCSLLTGVVLSLLVLAVFSPRSITANGDATRLLRSPTVSATHIAFAYANNIWTVDRAGRCPPRIHYNLPRLLSPSGVAL